MKLKFINEYKSITSADKAVIESLDLPDFSVITGTNGSSKTHLLEAISNGAVQVNVDDIESYGPITYFNYQDFFLSGVRGKDHTIPGQIMRKAGNNERFVFINKIHQITSGNAHLFLVSPDGDNVPLNIIKKWADKGSPDKESIIKCLPSNNHNQSATEVNQIFEVLKPEFDSLSKPLKKDLKNIEQSKIHTIFTANCDEDYLGRVIFEDWREYHIQLAEYRVDSDDEPNKDTKQEYIRTHGESPLKFFNEVLKEFGVNNYTFVDGFPLRNSEIMKQQQDIRDRAFMPMLKKGDIEISLGDLSSGEKILLAIASLIVKQRRKQPNDYLQGLLLLDEVDTNLHPSMMRNFLDVIQNVFIKEYGLKVILVTHSPTTIALVPEDSIFVMRRKEEEGARIEKSSGNDALSVLTEGFVSMTEKESEFALKYRLQKENKPVLFVEGSTDQMILEIAWNKLNPDKEIPFLVLDWYGADAIKNQFARKEIFSNSPNNIFIGLFDFDSKGMECWSRVKEDRDYGAIGGNNYIVKHKSEKGYCMLLPVPGNRSQHVGEKKDMCYLTTELLFSDEILSGYIEPRDTGGGGSVFKIKDKKKMKLAEAVKDFDVSEFENFKPLFQTVQDIISDTL